MKTTAEGIKMLWSIPTLAPGEEKIISYKMEAKRTLLGKLILPPAVARFKKGDKAVMVRTGKKVVKEKK